MARIEFYDGTSAHAHEALVTAYNGSFVIRANGQSYSVSAKDIQPTLSTPNGRRFIHLSNNMALEFHDNADAEQLLNALNAPHLKHMRWFDKNYRTSSFLITTLLTFTGLIAALYFFVLPIVVDKISASLPTQLLDKLSQSTLKELENSKILLPSKLSPEQQDKLTAQFEALKKPETNLPFKLHFYTAPKIGPNAFALPSGDVILLDELVNLSNNSQQTMGVLSHELGHIARRHTIRGIVQNSIISFAIAAWLGDYGSTTINFVTSSVFNQKYNRDFEREADDYAIKMLKLNKISPTVLADFFVLMEQQETDNMQKDDLKQTNTQVSNPSSNHNWLNILQSHPPTEERIATLREAAKSP